MTEEFQVLDHRTHVLKRPAMYIGSTSVETVEGIILGQSREVEVVPGLLKIFNEVLDNSVDEFIRTGGKHANKIDVEIETGPLAEPVLSVSDNGRGIPQDKPDGQHPRPILAWGRALSGTNFSSDEERETIGMNGLGAYLTNVYSVWFRGSTCDGKNVLYYTSQNNADPEQTDWQTGKSTKRGTKVSFQPDLTRMGGLEDITEDHITVIEDRLRNLAACFPSITFTLNGKTIKFESVKKFADQFGEDTVVYSDDDNIIVFANSGGDSEFKVLSYMNGLHIKNGGAHIDYIMDEVIGELRPMIKRRHKIDVLPNQIRQHVLLVSIARNMRNMKFDSQAKERITNTRKEIGEQLGNIDFKKIARKILDTEDIIQPIIHAILAKKELEERLAVARKQKKLKRARIPEHIEALDKDPENRTLFITEGKSATGPLLEVRDKKRVGGYPLKGKVLNTRGMKPADVFKNKELAELMSIIGLDYSDKPNQMNYGRIAIMTDADVDGHSIACMLVNFLSAWPELFEQGRVYRVRTPLYIARKGKHERWYYTQEEYAADSLNGGWKVQYYKGLGTLDKKTYGEMINNPSLQKITAPDDKQWDYLEMAFGSDSEPRKEWLTG